MSPATKRRDQYATRAIHVGSEPDPSTGAVVPSLSVATTFRQDGIGKLRGKKGFEYSRSDNPTRSALEALLTSLETGPSGPTSTPEGASDDADASGGDTLVFSSGSAATAAIAHWVTLTEAEGGAGGKDGNGGGGHILAVNDVYGGTARYLSRTSRPTGLDVTYLDMRKAGEEGIRAAIRPDTKLIWLEVPTNPTLLIQPLPLVAAIVNSLPAETRPLILVDTTFLSSFNITPLISTRPNGLPLADIAYSSLSKYSSGHSDIILGSLTVSPRAAALRPSLLKGLRFLQNSLGACPSPHDCHLMIRSLKTLSVRMVRHGLNALRIAAYLSAHPLVEDVRYPGFKLDPGFPLVEELLSQNARRELEFLGWKFPWKAPAANEAEEIEWQGKDTLAYTRTLGIPFGGVVTFTIKGASAEKTERFCTTLTVVSLAESLGGVESLIEVPAGMTHSGLPKETLKELGITPSLVRFSVGIEDYDDLVADLEEGFNAIRE